MTRFLQSAIRTVQGDLDSYQAAWHAVRARAEQVGVRAWMFCSAGDATRFLEFLEWKQLDRSGAPALDERVAEEFRGLDRFGPAATEIWIER